MIISGQVTYVGKTSLEITLWLDQINDDKLVRITRAHFVFVARDPTNTSSVMVNNLVPVGEREKNLMILSASNCFAKFALKKMNFMLNSQFSIGK